MSLQCWIHSIDSPDTCSGGLLLNDLQLPWSHNPSNEPLFTEQPILAAFCGTVKSAGERFWLSATGDGKSALKRIIGCALIAHLPDEAMDEALESLRDIFDFWSRSRHYILSQPTVGSPIKGKIVSSMHRPDLVIPE